MVVSNADGIADIGDSSISAIIAFATGFAPLRATISADVPTTEIGLSPGRRLQIICVDDSEAAVSGCHVHVTTAIVRETASTAEATKGVGNPASADAVSVSKTDHSGAAVFDCLPFSPVFIRVAHDGYFVSDPVASGAIPVDVDVKSVTVHVTPAFGLLVTLPSGEAPSECHFTVDPPDIDREVYGAREAMQGLLKARYPGCSAFVHAVRSVKAGTSVRAMAVAPDGALWVADACLRRLDQLMPPVVLQVPQIATGWARVEVRSAERPILGVRMILVDSGKRSWAVSNGMSIQLPADVYSVLLANPCPGFDEMLSQEPLVIKGGDGIMTMSVDLGRDVGWVTPIFEASSAEDVTVAITVNLENGDGMTMPRVASGELLILPCGRHRLSVYHTRRAIWNDVIDVVAGEHVTVKLGSLTR